MREWTRDQQRAGHEIARLLREYFPDQGHGLPLDAYVEKRRFGQEANVEVVCLAPRNPRGDVLTVLLFLRSNKEPYHASEWAVPGLFGFAGETWNKSIARLEEKHQMIFTTRSGAPWAVTENPRHPLGHTQHLIFLCTECAVQPSEEREFGWFPVDALPGNTIPYHQEKIIPAAVEAYNRWVALGAAPLGVYERTQNNVARSSMGLGASPGR